MIQLTNWTQVQQNNYYANSQVKVYFGVNPSDNNIIFWVAGLTNYQPTFHTIFPSSITNFTIDYGFGKKDLIFQNGFHVYVCDLKQQGNISTGFSKVVEYDLTIRTISIGAKSGSNNTTLFINQPMGDAVLVSCLLEGTIVKTPNGWTPIEKLKTGDYVTNQNGMAVRIKRMTKSRNEYNSKTNSNAMVYRVPVGQMGCTTELYVSKHHKIQQPDGTLLKAHKLNLELASQKEICDRFGRYVLYNLQVENHRENHLQVNGNCIVESWNGINEIRTKEIRIYKNKQRVSGF